MVHLEGGGEEGAQCSIAEPMDSSAQKRKSRKQWVAQDRRSENPGGFQNPMRHFSNSVNCSVGTVGCTKGNVARQVGRAPTVSLDLPSYLKFFCMKLEAHGGW